jgi:prepilin-type N-terminal cleavage/methylation domain-containing protein
MINKLRKQTGFTIIEVLIVLAIAGLILLIVFLAVPALQRNSRNTSRRNDVAVFLGAVSEFENNNQGALPSNLTFTAPNVYTIGCSSGTCTTSQAKLGFFTSGVGGGQGQVQFSSNITPPTYSGVKGPFNTAVNDRLEVEQLADCSTTTSGASVPGSARQVVAIFEVEIGTGATPYGGTCQSS